MITFQLTTDFIELHRLLKITGLSESGGEAKYLISQGLVKVNGEVETRKACKIKAGSKVDYHGEIIQVESASSKIAQKSPEV